MEKIVFIKLEKCSNGCNIINRFEQSLNLSKSQYYHITDVDKAKHLQEFLAIEEKCYIMAIVHENSNIDSIYLGYGTLKEQKSGYSGCSLMLEIRLKSEYNLSMKNICKLTDLNLDTDFHMAEYVLTQKSKLISEQIEFILNKPSDEIVLTQEYNALKSEESLNPLAQKNEYCRRKHNLRAPMEDRSEYQRDYERIVHSKAFRRMVDKAQVFSASKGDYYRTRMTHSQAVDQIARGIAVGLDLNMYLTEAIALGHDIGHTPFGHQGERTLDDVLRGKYDIIKNIEMYEDDGFFGGFKHNYQSLRVASLIEEEYFEIYGMDLSYQALEGMLKHTGLKREKFQLSQFIYGDDAKKELRFDCDCCSTLEGQVVAIADEIAQRGHDLDDALSSGVITFGELVEYLSIRKMDSLKAKLESIKPITESTHRLYDGTELRNSRIVSTIISYFIKDVIKESLTQIRNYDIEKFKDSGHSVSEQLISFSKEACTINQFLETIITSKVINSPEVSLFDSNAAVIVSSLFKAYYNNPRILHRTTLRRLYISLREVSPNVIDFEYGNHEIIREELALMTTQDLTKLDEAKKKEYKEKRAVLVRIICDYISGMTDTYAINEYKKIAK